MSNSKPGWGKAGPRQVRQANAGPSKDHPSQETDPTQRLGLGEARLLETNLLEASFLEASLLEANLHDPSLLEAGFLEASLLEASLLPLPHVCIRIEEAQAPLPPSPLLLMSLDEP
jgi:hypothetical protein